VGTDLWAVANEYISITPIRLDLTDRSMMEELRSWEFLAKEDKR
jgi:broad specificity polyphosphatase/5'/3'-nucleotidase SurE